MSYKMKEIKIKPAINGFIIEIGCKTFVTESVKKLLKELEIYIKDPEKAEKTCESKAINKENCNYGNLTAGAITTSLEGSTCENTPRD